MELLYNRWLSFNLDSFLKEDGFNIEELYFFWMVFLVVDFKLVGFLFIVIGLTRCGIDDYL
jgi:hypothetical protein